ncbi:hypothetical protein TNCV_3576501 [Trichonephila clavipes]|nr:hypothetical protein TNCV_3576501 [Trichonephila clavipes]
MYIQETDSAAIEVSTRPKLNGIVSGTAFLHVLRRHPTGWPDSRKRSGDFNVDFSKDKSKPLVDSIKSKPLVDSIKSKPLVDSLKSKPLVDSIKSKLNLTMSNDNNESTTNFERDRRWDGEGDMVAARSPAESRFKSWI